MIFFIIFAILIIFLLWLLNDHQRYFERRNVKYLKSTPLLGALKDTLLGRKSLYDNYVEIYNHKELKNEPFFGIFIFNKPALMIKDPGLIKKILVTDFKSFDSRYAACGVHDKIGYYSLAFGKHSVWKNMRARNSAFFTNAKLKSAYYLIEKVGNDFNRMIHKKFNGHARVELNLKPLTDLYFVDVIVSVSLGIEANSIANPESEFQIAATSIFKYTNFYRSIEFMSIWVLPKITKYFGFKFMPKYTNDLLCKVAPLVFAEREKSGLKRNDLIDILLEMKTQLEPEHKSHTTEDMMVSQIAMFLAAGFDTSSTTTSFLMYELSKNQNIQQKLRNEIKEMLENNNGKISYEAVANSSEMPYLQQVFLETLRLYNILPVLDRECNDPKGVSLEPFSDFVIPCGMPVFICGYAMSRDEKYFPNPLVFNPSRFAAENIDNIPSVYMPFGAGPRACIGEKLATIQTKVAICSILRDFRMEITKNTPESISLHKKAILIQPDKGLFVNFVKDPLIK